jgi:hypothetical protein
MPGFTAIVGINERVAAAQMLRTRRLPMMATASRLIDGDRPMSQPEFLSGATMRGRFDGLDLARNRSSEFIGLFRPMFRPAMPTKQFSRSTKPF